MQAAARRMSAMRSAVTNALERHTVPPRDEGGDLFGTWEWEEMFYLLVMGFNGVLMGYMMVIH